MSVAPALAPVAHPQKHGFDAWPERGAGLPVEPSIVEAEHERGVSEVFFELFRVLIVRAQIIWVHHGTHGVLTGFYRRKRKT